MPPWTVISILGTADWGFYAEAPLNQNGTGPTVFPSGPVYGTDGDRNPPYWDAITLDTSPWFGQNGQLRFTYETGDSCCSFERGWYLDFSYAICDDIAFP